jgi:hypothetical protein
MHLSTTFVELEQMLAQQGPGAAIDKLCADLRARKDYRSLFYALLMKSRHEMGVSPIPTGPSQDLPEKLHPAYESAIREAGQTVGRLYLDDGDIARAWDYYRMLGEPEPVARALDNFQPGESDDCQQIVDIALHQGVHPRKGFDLILERYGLCSAITTASNMEMPQGPQGPAVRDYCVKRLVRALYDELRERLRAEIERQEGKAPEATTVPELIAGRDWLFAEEFAHIDVSHLGSVVQMSVNLSPCEELGLARELCAYGAQLSPRFHYSSDPPFDDQYRDYGVFLAILVGDRVEEGIAHFRAKADNADPETVGAYPAQVLVNLLLRLDRPKEALEVARKHLTVTDGQPLSCPSVAELCQRTGDYRALAEAAREQGDPVHFVAGLIAANSTS